MVLLKTIVSICFIYLQTSSTLGVQDHFGYIEPSATEIDRWEDFVLIANPSQQAPDDGTVTGWRVYAPPSKRYKKFTFYLQIWRRVLNRSRDYRLIGQTKIERKSGFLISRVNLSLSQQFQISKGDVLGFRIVSPSQSPIPFTRVKCGTNTLGLYRRNSLARVSVGHTYQFAQLLRGWGACRKYSYQAIVSYKNKDSKEVIGHYPLRGSLETDGWTDFMKIPDPKAAAENNGTIIQWKLKLKNTGLAPRRAQLRLQVWRPSSSRLTYKLVHETKVDQAVPGRDDRDLQVPAAIRVQKGDVIGFRNMAGSRSLLPFIRSSCTLDTRVRYKRYLGFIDIGKSYTFTSMPTRYGACRHYALQAVMVYDTLPTPPTTTTVLPSDTAALGFFPTKDLEVDAWHNYMYILDPSLSARKSGTVIGWNVLIQKRPRGSGNYKVALQIWRPVSALNRATLVHQTIIIGPFSQGKSITRYVTANYSIQAGDMIGFRNIYGHKSAIPFRRLSSTCPTLSRALYYRHIFTARVGYTYQFTQMPVSYGPCRQYALQALIKYNPVTTVPPPPSTTPFTLTTNPPGINPFEGFTHLARGRQHIILPDTSSAGSSHISGEITGWQFHTNTSDPVVFQVWRPVERNRYALVGSTSFYDNIKGYNDYVLPANKYISFKPGDTFGLFFPKGESVPFRIRTDNCQNNVGKIHQLMSNTAVSGTLGFQDLGPFTHPCRNYAVLTSVNIHSDNATVYVPLVNFGGNLEAAKTGKLDKWTDFMLIPDRKIKIAKDGTIEGWTINARLNRDVYLQIWRMSQSDMYWSLVGETEIEAFKIKPNVTQRFDLSTSQQFKVKRGDVLGMWFPGEANIPFTTYLPCTHYGRYIRNYSTRRNGTGPKRVRMMSRSWGICRKYAIIAHINES